MSYLRTNTDAEFKPSDVDGIRNWLEELRAEQARNLVDRLTPRQRELLVNVACGLSVDEVAAHMKISKGTVGNERAEICALLGVPRVQVACIVACKAGLL